MDSIHGMNNTEVSDIVTGTSGMTVNIIILCHLYASLKRYVNKESIDPNISTIKPDTDINSDSDTVFIFSTADCGIYDRLTRDGYGQCATEVGPYNYDRNLYEMLQFTKCVFFFFMTKMGAIETCSNPKYENAMILLSKGRVFYSFMTDSLGLSDVCEKYTTVSYVTGVKKGISNTHFCYVYSQLKSPNAENICRPTSEKDTLANGAGILHYVCVWYRSLTEESTRFFL